MSQPIPASAQQQRLFSDTLQRIVANLNVDGGNVLAAVLPDPVGSLLRQVQPFGPILLYVLMLSGVLSVTLLPIRSSLRSALL